jgi:uncharacterized membrane protein
MSRHITTLVFLAVLAAAGVFVFVTSSSLPERVASHFGSSGVADAFMSCNGYVTFMLAFVVGLPLLTTGIMTLVFRSSTTSLNMPHRDYWLAPNRRASTLAFLIRHNMLFGGGLAVFLSYVHWLVVQANAQQPAVLSNSGIYAGLGVFLLALAGWAVWLWLAFRRTE